MARARFFVGSTPHGEDEDEAILLARTKARAVNAEVVVSKEFFPTRGLRRYKIVQPDGTVKDPPEVSVGLSPLRKCVNGSAHIWEPWHEHRHANASFGTYDPTQGEFVYERECQVFGCGVRERTNELEPKDSVYIKVTS